MTLSGHGTQSDRIYLKINDRVAQPVMLGWNGNVKIPVTLPGVTELEAVWIVVGQALRKKYNTTIKTITKPRCCSQSSFGVVKYR